MKKVKTGWFKKMLDKMQDTPEFKEEMLKLYKEEIHDLQVALQKSEEMGVGLEREVEERKCQLKALGHDLDCQKAWTDRLEEMVKRLEEALQKAEEKYSNCLTEKESQIEQAVFMQRSRAEKAEERANTFDLALQSLTPGGSEFVNDPERCVDFVQGTRASQMNFMRAQKKVMMGLEDEKKLLSERMNGLEEALQKAEEKYSKMYNVMSEQNSLIATHLDLPGDGRLLSEQVIEAFDKAEAKVSIWKNQYNLLEKQASEWEEKLEKAEERVEELESKEIGCKKVIEEFQKVNPKLETKIKDLEGENLGLRKMISDYQRSCKGWEDLSVVAREKIEELEGAVDFAANSLEASGLCFDHPTVIKLQKLIEKKEDV